MLTHHYTAVLHLHSGLRWLILVSGLVLIAGCLLGKINKSPYKPSGKILSVIYVSLMDTQFLVGLLLSFASPYVRGFWSNPAVGMKSHDLRFFAMEHTSLMVTALILAHIGSARSRKVADDTAAYTTALKWYTPSFLLILVGIPWWRPLLS